MKHVTLLKFVYVVLAVAGFVWPEAAQFLGGLVLFMIVVGKPKE